MTVVTEDGLGRVDGGVRFGYVSYLYKSSRQEIAVRLTAAVAGARLDAVAGANLDRWLSVVGGSGAHTLLDLASHRQEGLLDIASVLGRGLEKWDAQAVGELLWKPCTVSKVGPIAIAGWGARPACDGASWVTERACSMEAETVR